MELSEKVRRRREELGMTQDMLAQRMGYKSRVSINKIENGRPVSQKIIARLADALDVSIPYLMGWDQEPEELADITAQVLLNPGTLAMVEQYLQLSESDQYTIRLMVASLAEKTQKKTDAGVSQEVEIVSLLETE